MKTEQAIRKLGQTLWDILGREYIDKYCEDKNGNLVSVSSISVEDIAEELVNAGYGDVSEYKAEIERLRTTLGQCNAELNSALESLKSQCREIGELKAGVKQAQIDILNKVKDIVFDYLCVKNIKEAEALSLLDSTLTYDVVTCGIDELIKEVQDE